MFCSRVLFEDTIFTKKRGLFKLERSFMYDRSLEASMIVKLFAC